MPADHPRAAALAALPHDQLVAHCDALLLQHLGPPDRVPAWIVARWDAQDRAAAERRRSLPPAQPIRLHCWPDELAGVAAFLFAS